MAITYHPTWAIASGTTFSIISAAFSKAGTITEVGGGTQRADATSSGQVASLAKAFPANVTSGSLLLVSGAAWPNLTSITVTATGSGSPASWSSVVASQAGSSNTRAFIAWGFAAASGACTVTVTPQANEYFSYTIDEFAAVAAKVTDSAPGINSSGNTATDTITTAGHLIVGVIGSDGSGGGITVSAPWTQMGSVVNNSTSQSHNSIFQLASTPPNQFQALSVAP